ncbi:MAG: alpha/beta hydrolase [Chloroflexota bacterium]
MNHTLDTSHGRLVYQESGSGPPIIFLHGVLSNANTWRKIIPQLAENYRCIVPTLPLGAHTVPIYAQEPITGLVIAAMLEDMVDHLQLDHFTLIGNDTGGAYAQIYTAQYPTRVSHLILTNCDAFDVFPPPVFASLQSAIKIPWVQHAMALTFHSAWFSKSKYVLGRLSKTLDGQTIQQQYLQTFMQYRHVRNDFKQAVLGWEPHHTLEAAEALVTFTNPVLVLWGEADTDLFPMALGQRIAGIFPNARLITVPEALTYIQEDAPEAFVKHIRHFLTPM